MAETTPTPAWRMWLGRAFVLSVLLGTWAVATPDFSAPDEPAHVIRAAAVADGQIGARSSDELGPGLALVDDIPRSLDAGWGIAACFVHDPTATPCGPPFVEDDVQVEAITTAGSAPPLFYGLVGLPLRVMPDSGGLLLARLAHAAACAALIASAAILAARSRHRGFLLVGLAVAVTPMAVYLGAVVNPSGLEIAAGIATWVTVLVIAGDAGRPSRWPLALLATAGSILVLSRALSAVYFVIVVGIVVLAAGWRAFDPRDRRIQVVGAALGLAFAGAAGWVLTHDPTDLVPALIIREADWFEKLSMSVGKTPRNIEQMVAAFGWLDSRSPQGVLFIWLFTAAALVLLALHLNRSSRGRWALLLLLVGSFLLPLAIELPGYDEYGLIFQGRYALPVVVGIPLLAGWLLDRAPATSRDVLDGARTTLVAGLWVAHCVAFWFHLRRYAMGADASILIPFDVEWSPRLHPWVLMAIVAVASGEWCRWLVRRGASDAVGEPAT
ncbi:MAG: DUF2142 domain-containing protein [Acidimicrobiales bacterium]